MAALIYMIDDEPVVLELAEAVLRSQGFEVRTFTDGPSAIEEFKHAPQQPTLVVSDYVMEPLNGLDVIARLKQVKPDLKTMLISGTVSQDIMRNAPVKADVFLSKPYTADNFLETVRKLVR